VVSACGATYAVRRQRALSRGQTLALPRCCVSGIAWAVIAGWAVYVAYALGWLPGASALQAAGRHWAAGALTFAAGLVSWLWSGPSAGRD
jgi:hypothetical protein